LTLDVKKSNSSNDTPNVMTVGVENYGLNVEFRERKKLILNQVLISSNIISPTPVPKLPESTRRKQAIL
jgi:hypothetical protein